MLSYDIYYPFLHGSNSVKNHGSKLTKIKQTKFKSVEQKISKVVKRIGLGGLKLWFPGQGDIHDFEASFLCTWLGHFIFLKEVDQRQAELVLLAMDI